ncbi:hypothetical protein BcanWU425_32815 [Bradyrhizobium sp. WU425]|nr:hypothetical protein BcanWU425_32815 [Bradyrhizobium canariense]
MDVSLLDAAMTSLNHDLQIIRDSPPSRRTWGNGALAVGVFRCADDEMMLMVGNDPVCPGMRRSRGT